jgi:hypothetical protein
MKAIMILGANIGFLLGLGTSILNDCSGATAIWHAGAAALAGGILGRWWGKVWFAELESAMQQRERERAEAEAKSSSAKA